MRTIVIPCRHFHQPRPQQFEYGELRMKTARSHVERPSSKALSSLSPQFCCFERCVNAASRERCKKSKLQDKAFLRRLPHSQPLVTSDSEHDNHWSFLRSLAQQRFCGISPCFTANLFGKNKENRGNAAVFELFATTYCCMSPVPFAGGVDDDGTSGPVAGWPSGEACPLFCSGSTAGFTGAAGSSILTFRIVESLLGRELVTYV